MEIVVLRVGHRIERDRRVTTHVGLCARALGAQGMLLAASDRSVVSTMYGENLPHAIGRLESEKLMVVVGAEKVPPDLYRLADYNVAVTNQPHSEIAALSVFLDHLQRGQELKADFEGKMKIIGNMSNKVGVKRSEQIN